MMTDKRTRKQWMIAAVVLAVLVYSAAGIDYSGLAYFSPSMAGDVFRGLAKPAWGYVFYSEIAFKFGDVESAFDEDISVYVRK